MQDFSDNIDGFNVTWIYSGPCSGELILNVFAEITDGSTRTFAVTNIQPNSEYSVRVEAVNRIGSSSGNLVVSTSVQG